MQRAIPIFVGLLFAVPIGVFNRIVASTAPPLIAGEVRVMYCLPVPTVMKPFRRKLGDSYGWRGAGELVEACGEGLAEQREGVARPPHCLADRLLPEKSGPVLAGAGGSSCGGGR